MRIGLLAMTRRDVVEAVDRIEHGLDRLRLVRKNSLRSPDTREREKRQENLPVQYLSPSWKKSSLLANGCQSEHRINEV
ncbi:hypothetical protein [Dyella sp.]|uniref:hypothetical protein n=1 Tax=Dyella sp. TaxID=1869338 RepID=UPI002ED3B255